MKDIIKKIDGNKTTIGASLLLLLWLAGLVFPEKIDKEWLAWFESAVYTWTGASLGHKYLKYMNQKK